MVFECKRFVLDHSTGLMEEAHAAIGPTHDDILVAREGLTTATHASMLDHIGSNHIPFGVSPLNELISEEIVSFFYLYQIAMYLVWMDTASLYFPPFCPQITSCSLYLSAGMVLV